MAQARVDEIPLGISLFFLRVALRPLLPGHRAVCHLKQKLLLFNSSDIRLEIVSGIIDSFVPVVSVWFSTIFLFLTVSTLATDPFLFSVA